MKISQVFVRNPGLIDFKTYQTFLFMLVYF
jgi:hypothetical protein